MKTSVLIAVLNFILAVWNFYAGNMSLFAWNLFALVLMALVWAIERRRQRRASHRTGNQLGRGRD